MKNYLGYAVLIGSLVGPTLSVNANAALIPLPELVGYYAPGGGVRILQDGTLIATEAERSVLFDSPVASTETELVIFSMFGRIVNWPYPVDGNAELHTRLSYEEYAYFNPFISFGFNSSGELNGKRISHNYRSSAWTGLKVSGPAPFGLNGNRDLVVEITSAFLDDPNANSIPTPTTLALFGLGLASLGWSRRKKM